MSPANYVARPLATNLETKEIYNINVPLLYYVVALFLVKTREALVLPLVVELAGQTPMKIPFGRALPNGFYNLWSFLWPRRRLREENILVEEGWFILEDVLNTVDVWGLKDDKSSDASINHYVSHLVAGCLSFCFHALPYSL